MLPIESGATREARARSAGRKGGKGDKGGLSVKTSLRLAFAIVLAGTLAIGGIALTQISRLNALDGIHLQSRVSPRRRRTARGYVLRANRSPVVLLTA